TQHVVIEARSDDGRGLRYCACSGRQAAQANGYGFANAAGELELGGFEAEPVAICPTVQASGIDERLERLTQEEHVAARPAIEQRRKVAGDVLVEIKHL